MSIFKMTDILILEISINHTIIYDDDANVRFNNIVCDLPCDKYFPNEFWLRARRAFTAV